MPLYEYYCKKCGKYFEMFQSITEGVPEICMYCKKKKSLRRLISKTSFQLNGGGWYKDGYSNHKR